MVKQAKRHIYEGDIFQIVLSNRWHTVASGSLFQTYQILKDINPSPYLFYLQMSNIEIIVHLQKLSSNNKITAFILIHLLVLVHVVEHIKKMNKMKKNYSMIQKN